MTYRSENNRRDLERAREEIYSPSPRCDKCSQFKMCLWIRNIISLSESAFGMLRPEDRPFDPMDQAKVCKQYKLETKDLDILTP